jgi:hypothetical protein
MIIRRGLKPRRCDTSVEQSFSRACEAVPLQEVRSRKEYENN